VTPKAFALAAGISRAKVWRWRLVAAGRLEVARDGPHDRVRVRRKGDRR